jgi:hypothetical protein
VPRRRHLAWLLVLLLMGGHAAGVQAAAWISMLASRTVAQGWRTAVATTFDGAHPCGMCRAAAALREQEAQRQPPAAPSPQRKVELAPPPQAILPEAPRRIVAELVWDDPQHRELPRWPPPRPRPRQA